MSTNKPCVHYITITRNGILSLHDKATTVHCFKQFHHLKTLGLSIFGSEFLLC